MADTEDPQASGAGGQPDIAIDTSEASRGTQKVELDLEDAPFLEEEEEVQPEPPKPTASVSLEEPKEEKPSGGKKKKLIIIGAGALVLLIVAALAVKFLFFKGPKAAPEPGKTEHAAPPPAENATAPAEPEKPDVHVRLEPFWVEQKAGDEIRFLIVRMQLSTKDPVIAKEFEAKLLPARNAVFYYLKNKDVQFLADENNAEKLKAELLLVINQYVTDGKFDSLMFEEYVVK